MTEQLSMDEAAEEYSHIEQKVIEQYGGMSRNRAVVKSIKNRVKNRSFFGGTREAPNILTQSLAEIVHGVFGIFMASVFLLSPVLHVAGVIFVDVPKAWRDINGVKEQGLLDKQIDEDEEDDG